MTSLVSLYLSNLTKLTLLLLLTVVIIDSN
jgi:hypothetical protein